MGSDPPLQGKGGTGPSMCCRARWEGVAAASEICADETGPCCTGMHQLAAASVETRKMIEGLMVKAERVVARVGGEEQSGESAALSIMADM